MEGIRIIGYTDNTKEGVRKKKVQNTINRIDHMIYEIHDKAEILQWKIEELEEQIDFMENVKLRLEDGEVDSSLKNDLEECKFIYEDVSWSDF